MKPKSAIADLLVQEIPGFSLESSELSFEELGVDSFAMLELRAAVEHAIGAAVPDDVWVQLESPARLLSHCGETAPRAASGRADVDVRREYALNMPQMALGGLSESWLFKELGDAHWSMITAGLGAPSSALRDGNGERLYATFTRLRIEASAPLATFEENDEVVLEGRISRFGAGMFFSEMVLAGANRRVTASIMSSFTKRGSPSSNTGLLKGQPSIPPDCRIPDLSAMPDFGKGYRERRNGTLSPAQFETNYDIVPYHDINGVGLLYFAAYPTISDICELKYMGRGNQWALDASTVSRDVFYLANSDAHERLKYRVHAKKETPGGIEIESSISRGSDGALMAYLVTKKVVAGA